MAHNSDYHHGNLKRDLIEKGLELIVEKGINGFTLREVARRAGVSTAAPYHHFKNKAELLQAMAIEGWQLMGDSFEVALQKEITPKEKLIEIGYAYINFAVENVAYFRAMSRPDLFCKEDEDGDIYSKIGIQVFNKLEGAVLDCFPGSNGEDKQVQRMVLNSWVTVHGLATLWIDGPIKVTHFGELGIEKLIDMLFGFTKTNV